MAEQVFDSKVEQVFFSISGAAKVGEHPFDEEHSPMPPTPPAATGRDTGSDGSITERQLAILKFVEKTVSERGYPPSVREIGAAVGLTSPSSVHNHLETLQRLGYLRKDPTKPRAIEVRYDSASGASADRSPVRHVPLVGDVAAGTGVIAQEHVEELVPLPASLTGEGELFMLRVRGDSMIEAGIFDGDFVVVRSQPTANAGDIVVAGIPGEEATVKTFQQRNGKVVLVPANSRFETMVFQPDEVQLYGRVVTVLRKM